MRLADHIQNIEREGMVMFADGHFENDTLSELYQQLIQILIKMKVESEKCESS